MFKDTYQSGLLTVFFSCGSNPLALWEMEVKNGHIKRVTDSEVSSIVLEIASANVTTTYISCPRSDQPLLGITLPFLVLIVKNMKKYFSFEITVLDDTNMRRRFRISNYQTTTSIRPFFTTMPIGLSIGWNQIQFNLTDFTRRAYGTGYVETQKIQVNANTRLRRIYFCDRLYTEEELPHDYKLYLPLEKKDKRPIPLKKASKIIEPRKSRQSGSIAPRRSLISNKDKETDKKSGAENQNSESLKQPVDDDKLTGIEEEVENEEKTVEERKVDGDEELLAAEELHGEDTEVAEPPTEPLDEALPAEEEVSAKSDIQSKEKISTGKTPERKASLE